VDPPEPIDIMGLPETKSQTLQHIADTIPTYAEITAPKPSDYRDNETCRWVMYHAGKYARKYPSLMPHMLDMLHSTRNPDTELYHAAIDTFDEACRRHGIALDLED
jgi:hypothetical protein